MSDRCCRPRLQVVKGRGPNSDPHLLTPIWNREWTAGEHGGFAGYRPLAVIPARSSAVILLQH